MIGKKVSCICTSLLCCAMTLSWASQRAVADVESDLQAMDYESQKKAEFVGTNYSSKAIDEAIEALGSTDTDLIFEFLNSTGDDSGAPRGGAPANDTCAAAEPLTIGGANVIGDNTTATDDVIPSGTCTTTTPFKGLWYSVVGDGTTLTVSTCFPGTVFDTKVQVFCGCFDYVCIGGNDDASPADIPNCGIAGNNRKSRFSWCSAVGQMYFIHVGGFNAAAFGAYEIGVTSNGTSCATAISCTPSVRRCCYLDGGVASCMDVTAGACAGLGGTWGSSGQTCATACPTGRCCYNDGGTSACATQLFQSQCDALSGIWTASSSCATACPAGRCCYDDAGTPSCIDAANEALCRDLGGSWYLNQTCAARPCLANEYCATAEDVTSLPFAATPNVTGAGGSFKPAAVSGCNPTTARQMQNDIWYKYTPAADCALAFHADSPSYDSVYAVYTGTDCGSLTQVTCADAEPHNFAVSAVAGTTYWFQVGKWGTSSTPPATGTTNITLNCVVGGACCLEDGSCLPVADQAACDTLTGTYGGDGSDCSVSCGGACCLTNGTCSDEVSQIACDNAGGSFKGRGTACATTVCPAVNDDCANALPIFNGTTPFNLQGATTDGPNETTCAFPSGGVNQNINQDLWYTYTATCTGTLFVDTCGAATTDTRLAIYDGFACPPAGLPIECNDDHSNGTEADTGHPCVAESLAASLSIPVVSGQVYTIRVGAFSTSGTISGADQLNVECFVPPTTGACCEDTTCTDDVEEANCAGVWSGGMTCAEVGCLGRCCYTFFGVLEQCDVTSQAACELIGGAYEGIWTAGLTCADPCPTGSCCQGDGSCTVTTEDACNDNLGTWTEGGVCDPNTCPMPPANDTCETAIAVNCGDVVNGDSSLGTNDYDPTAAGCTGFAALGNDVVYSITLPVDRTVELLMDTNPEFDASLYVVTDCNDVLGTCVAGADDNVTTPGDESLSFNATANTTYYIICDAFGADNGGAFTLTVNCPIGECGSCPADMDGDGRFTGKDVQAFTDCVVGAVNGIPSGDCGCADLNGDQLVDLNDVPLFAAALTDFNAKLCPPGAGRCCISGGTVCDDTLTQIECELAGGSFTPGETCATACPQLADECVDAVNLAVPSTFTYSNAGLTPAGQDNEGLTCGSSVSSGESAWFSVVGTGNTVTVTTCEGVTDVDTVIRVYCGSCTDLLCVGANDDNSGDATCALPPPQTFSASRFSWCTAAGQVYLINIGVFNNSNLAIPQIGTIQVTVSDNGTPCATPPMCAPITGACCQGNSCSVETPGVCSNLGGTYLGDGSDCTGNPCANGACCHPDGSCTLETDATACTNAGGTAFAGVGVTCLAANCPQPGQPGETCALATTIPSLPFSTQFNNDLALPDAPGGSCNSGVTVMQNAVWYTYTPATDCTLVLNIDPDAGLGYDGIALVHSGPDCNNLTTLTPCLDEPEPMSGTFPATAGTTYWFQVGDWGSSEGGGLTDFSLDCVVGGACCHSDGTCSDVASSGDCVAVGDVYQGDTTSCATTICGGACCFANGSCTDENSALDCSNAGGTYQGDGTACATTACPQPPPANDDCGNAIDITASINGGSVLGNNSGATPAVGPDAELPVGSPTCQWNGTPEEANHTVWYSFTAPANGSVTVGTCNTTPNPLGEATLFQDSVIALFSGTCGGLVEVGCEDDTTGCGPADDYLSQIVTTTLTPGATYYLMVANPGSWAGSFPGAYVVDITSP